MSLGMKFPWMEGDAGNSFSISSRFYLDLNKNCLPSQLITIFLLGIRDSLLVLWEAQGKARRKDLTAGGEKKKPPKIPPICLSLHLLKCMFVGERAIHTNLDLNNTGQWQKKWTILGNDFEFPGFCQVCHSLIICGVIFVCVCVGGILLARTLKLELFKVSHFHLSTYLPDLRDENIPHSVLDVKAICRWWYRWLLRELI